MLAQAERGVGLVAGAKRDRATVGPADDPLLGEPRQVAPDGLVRDAERLDEVAAAHAALLPDQVRDDLEAVRREQLLGHRPSSCGHRVGGISHRIPHHFA